MSYPKMYIFLNKSLDMSLGKAAAQTAHAAIKGYDLSRGTILDEWKKAPTKIILEARDSEHIRTIKEYLVDHGVKCDYFIDNPSRDMYSHQITALGCQVVDPEDPQIGPLFGTFNLYSQYAKPNWWRRITFLLAWASISLILLKAIG